MLLRIASFASLASLAAAQTIPDRKWSLGITAGVPLVRPQFLSGDESKRYTFGTRLDWQFNENLSVTVNPLYKRNGHSFGYLSVPPPEVRPEPLQPWLAGFRVRSHSLELPAFGSYHFRRADRRWRPLLSAGFNLRTEWQDSTTNLVVYDGPDNAPRTQQLRGHYRTGVFAGALAGLGVSIRHGRFSFVPEVRYTYWGPSRQNQVDALFSIRF